MTRQLPSPRLATFAVAGTIKAAGTGFYYPFSLLFFATVLDTTYSEIGAVLTIAGLVALPLLPAVGRVVDRTGGRVALVTSLLLRAATFVVLVVAPSFAVFIGVAVINALAARVDAVATQLLCAELPEDGGAFPRWLAVYRSTFNLGFGLGTIAAGLLLSVDRGVVGNIGFVVAAGFSVAAVMYAFLRPVRDAPDPAPSSEGDPPEGSRRTLDRRYVVLTVVSSVTSAAGLFIESATAPYLLAHTSAPAWLAGVLIALNTVLLATLFVPMEAAISRRRQIRMLRLSCVLIVLGFVALPTVGTGAALPVWVVVTILVLGFIVYSAGELVSTQVLGVLLTALPAPARRGSALSFGQLVSGAVAAVVPWAVGLVLDANTIALWTVVLVPMIATIAVTYVQTLRTTLDEPVDLIIAPPRRASI